MSDLKWFSKKVRLGDLKDYEKNPRIIKKLDYERLVMSIQEMGYHNRILVDTDNTIIGGHMRKKALFDAGLFPKDEIEVISPNRKLTEKEFKCINIQDNLPFGNFDFNMLANDFEVETLKDWGMPETWLPAGIGKEDMEMEEGDFSEFKHLCPKCGFEFNIPKISAKDAE